MPPALAPDLAEPAPATASDAVIGVIGAIAGHGSGEVAAATAPAVRSRRARRIALVAVTVLCGVVAIGQLSLASASWVLQATTSPLTPHGVAGIGNLRVVDAHVWRGAAPSVEGYSGLAASGVTTVVDLRAEDHAYENDAIAAASGLTVVHLPIRDGQLPSDAQVAAFLATVEASTGTVFVHCGAGVGRTGAMAAAYLTQTGQTSGREALVRNLSVGPPSLEQVWFAAGLGDGGIDRPPAPVVVLSRLIDAPRRLLSYL